MTESYERLTDVMDRNEHLSAMIDNHEHLSAMIDNHVDHSDQHRRCVIAMDGSEHSDYALEWYCSHIHHTDDLVIMVYVPDLHNMLHSSKWNNSVYVFDRNQMESMLKSEQNKVKGDLDKFAEKLREHGLGGKVKSVIANKAGEGILKAVEDEHADLIVVGSRGQGTIRRTLLGSVSDYLVHHSHVPVLVCKHPNKHVHLHDMH